MTELVKKKKVRGGHRAHATKLLGTARDLEDYDETGKDTLMQTKIALTEKLKTLKRLDDTILDLVSADDDGEKAIAAEIEDSEKIKSDIRAIILAIEKKLSENLAAVPLASEPVPSPPPKNEMARARLPKLEVKKFSGRIHEWQEFWDSFQSAIHQNDSLSDVDKFSYLRGLIEGPAKSSIAGFALTEANYKAAIELLQRRFGKKIAIERAHISELLKVQPAYRDRDPGDCERYTIQ